MNCIAPCKDCQKRKLHCHSTCSDYAAFREEIESRNKKRKLYNDSISSVCQSISRAMKTSSQCNLKNLTSSSQNDRSKT